MLRFAGRKVIHRCHQFRPRTFLYGCHRLSTGSGKKEEEMDEWIPPNRPLVGDQGQAHLYKQAERVQETEERLEEAMFTISDDDSQEDILRKLEEVLALEEKLEEQLQEQELDEESEETIDWLQTRRATLGEEQQKTSDIVPVIQHKLLTEEELLKLLEFLGGTDVTVLLNHDSRLGGVVGMILCTASSSFQIRTITQGLVGHLKERNLQEAGVQGANMGSKYFQNNLSSNWNVIDCQDYIVHILDESTRRALNLEQLWSGKDPLWELEFEDEEAVDDYVASHPVPFDYGPNPGQVWGTDISKLQRNQFTAPHRPVVPSEVKSQDRKIGRRRRREQRNQQKNDSY